MNMVLSMSHDPNTGLTCGVVLTWSDEQTAFISEELKRYDAMAGYPLLLPILFTAYQRRLLHQEGQRIWKKLLEVETASGQTGVPVIFDDPYALSASSSFDEMTKGVLQVVQLAAGWVNYTEVLLSAIEAIQESIRHINTTTPHARLDYVEAAESVMVEYLGFISHRCKVMLLELQYIYKRGQAQMTAVSIAFASGFNPNILIKHPSSTTISPKMTPNLPWISPQILARSPQHRSVIVRR